MEELAKKLHAFDFLIDKTKNKIRLELELSLKVGEIVGKTFQTGEPKKDIKKIFKNSSVDYVACVIIDFSVVPYSKQKIIFDGDKKFS